MLLLLFEVCRRFFLHTSLKILPKHLIRLRFLSLFFSNSIVDLLACLPQCSTERPNIGQALAIRQMALHLTIQHSPPQ